VEVGLYLLTTGERLPAIQPDGTAETRILLSPIHVVR